MRRKRLLQDCATAIVAGLLTAVIVVLLIMFATGCVHGRGIHRDGADIKDIDLIVHWVAETTGWPLLGEWEVVLLDQFIRVHTRGGVGFADGYTDEPNRTIYVYVYDPCLAQSSLIHELLHAYGLGHGKLLRQWEITLVDMATRELCISGYQPVPYPPPPKRIDDSISLMDLLGV